MTLLADITTFMSEVGRERPDLVQDRNFSLFERVVERARAECHRDESPSDCKAKIAATTNLLSHNIGLTLFAFTG